MSPSSPRAWRSTASVTHGASRVVACLVVLAAACGQQPDDYAPAALRTLGLSQSLTYVARTLVTAGAPPLIAHPRMGHAAILRAGDPFEVAWVGPSAVASLVGPDGVERALPLVNPIDDMDHVWRAQAVAPDLAGSHALCLTAAQMHICTKEALHIVAEFHDPALVAQVSDVHAGDGDSAALFGKAVDDLNARTPPPDLVVMTGDCADTGTEAQRQAFLGELERLRLPSLVITGNHDYDALGVNGYLLDINPELELTARYGELRFIALSTGQDLDDGNHPGTISESDGPDPSELDGLSATLADAVPTVLLLHHPLYNGLFGTVGPARDEMLNLLNNFREPNQPVSVVRAVLAGHTHYSAVFDGDGVAGGLSVTEGSLPQQRWPLHHTASRVSRAPGGYALLTLGTEVVQYRWVALPSS